MKELPHPLHVMQTMYGYISAAYSEKTDKQKGIIQFCFKEKTGTINCYFKADGNRMDFVQGISETCDVRLQCTFSDWLALAGKKLNPVLGVMLGKLKFKGDVGCFKRIIPTDLFRVDISGYSDQVSPFETHPEQNWEKPEKVLLIDSSPRGRKGYTSLYCDQIEQYIREKEVEINRITLSEHNIQPCLGCLHCWLKKNGECILKDDVAELYRDFEEADLILYAFPLYAYGVPGLLKNFMDRGVMQQYPYFEKGISEIRHPRRIRKNQAFAVFSICGFPSFSQFDSVKELFRLYTHSRHSPLVAEIYRPAGIFLLQNPFCYNKLTTFLDGLRNACHEIIDIGKIKHSTQRKLRVKVNETDFLKSSNKYWDNLKKEQDADY